MFMLLGSLMPSMRNFRRVLVNPFYRLIEHRQVPAQKRFRLTIQLDTGFYQRSMTKTLHIRCWSLGSNSVSITPWLRIVRVIDIKK